MRRLLAITAAALALGCAGPRLHLDNPGRHEVYVDGVRSRARSLPFRYYGTSRWDALPADRAGLADFDHRPATAAVPLPPPAPLWLFPLDFAIELFSRAVHGRGDTTAQVAVAPALPPLAVGPDQAIPAASAGAIAARARAARILR